MAIKPSDIFEVGIIVEDLERTMTELHESVGNTFTPVLDGWLPVHIPGDPRGKHLVPFKMCYTREAPVFELVQEVPGSILTRPEGTTLHHLGYHVDDLEGEIERLEAMGMPLVMSGWEDDRVPALWSYHQTPYGYLIELVDGRFRADFHQIIAGEEVPDSWRVAPEGVAI